MTLWGWSLGAGIIFGLSLSVASTVVLLRALEDRDMIKSNDGRIAIGWLVVEDLLMVLTLVLLPALTGVLGGDLPNNSGNLWLALGITIAALPILLVVLVYLPLRWRFVREASAGQRFIDASADLDLFALRAMSNQPMHRLARISPDPVRAWREGDPDVVRALAVLELKDSGLTPPGSMAS